MKQSLLVFVPCLMLISMLANGQAITNVRVTLDKPSYNGACPAKITFTAVISYTGTGSIQYTWLRSDGAKAPTRTLQLKGGGTETVTTSWQLGKSFRGWQALKIISPVQFQSQNSSFSVNCTTASKVSTVSRQVKQPATNHPIIKKPIAGAVGQPKN